MERWNVGGLTRLASSRQRRTGRSRIGGTGDAIVTGERRRVFCASLADVFDIKAPKGACKRLFKMISRTQNLDWLLLTKRPDDVRMMLPKGWGDGYEKRLARRDCRRPSLVRSSLVHTERVSGAAALHQLRACAWTAGHLGSPGFFPIW